MKLKREDILSNQNRERVYNYVQSNPGDHFRSILQNLSMKNGTLAHHLYTLEKEEYIKSERDGPFKRFYPRGRAFTSVVLEVNGAQGKILNIVSKNPGITQKEIATRLDIREKRVPEGSKGDPVREVNIRIHCMPDHDLEELQQWAHDQLALAFAAMSPAERHGGSTLSERVGSTGRTISRKERD